MDPQATFREILKALDDAEYQTAIDRVRDLNDWLGKGGFAISLNHEDLLELVGTLTTISIRLKHYQDSANAH